MTNTPSGSKRPWEGGSTGHRDSKRPKEDSADRPDSRHVSSARRERDHHHSDRRSSDSGRRRDTYERENRAGRRRDSRSHSRSRRPESEHRKSLPKQYVAPPNAPADDEREEGEISPRAEETSLKAEPQKKMQASDAVNPPMELDQDGSDSPESLEQSLAARRARREAILAKYSQLEINSPIPSNLGASTLPSNTPIETDTGTSSSVVQEANNRTSLSPSPEAQDFALAKEDSGPAASITLSTERKGEANQISAADYDPSLDRREDEQRRVNGPGNQQAHDEAVVEEVEEEDEDVDDMFAVDTPPKKVKKRKVVTAQAVVAPALITTTLDSAADAEGYYSIILGEQLDSGRYQVFSSLGKGMFANVVRARVLPGDHGDPAGKEVAIKIIRTQESMYKAGLKEASILNKLKQADPDDKKHIIRLERTFEHRGHLCLVFENMSMNLRDVVKRFGKDVGLNIRAVRAYAQQLFLALTLLKKLNIMHADIKPDNILVNEAKKQLKLCDLGSASDASENEITPYLVSRFYRAPEIILGIPYDPSLDIWSIGCTLYELYTGKILFPGRSNNQMLVLMMELKGRFNTKMVKKAKFGDVFFDEMGGFNSVETDRVTGGDVVRKVFISNPTKDLRARLMPSSAKLKDDESKMVLSFIDLLDKCLALDPGRRITPKDALAHSFIRG